MIILLFGFCPLKVSRRYEFGDPKLSRMLRVDLLIVSVFVLNHGVFIKAARAIAGGDRDFIESVRLARRKAYKRALAEARSQNAYHLEQMKKLYQRTAQELDEAKHENHGLKIALKALRDDCIVTAKAEETGGE